MFKSRLIHHSAIKYLAVGGAAFASDYAVLLLLYQVLQVPLFWATSAGFITGFAISFFTNRQWVFGGLHSKRFVRQLVEYLALAVFNYAFTVQTVAFLNNHGIRPYIGKLVVMAMIVVWNYALFRWVIFSHQRPDPEQD